VMVLLWFLVLGDSGVGKSKVRSTISRSFASASAPSLFALVARPPPTHALSTRCSQARNYAVKAMKVAADFLSKEGEGLGMPPEMIERAVEAHRSFTADPTAAGILNMAEKAGMDPAKLIVRAAPSRAASHPPSRRRAAHRSLRYTRLSRIVRTLSIDGRRSPMSSAPSKGASLREPRANPAEAQT
jgi:stage V sporulation protein SpoVS